MVVQHVLSQPVRLRHGYCKTLLKSLMEEKHFLDDQASAVQTKVGGANVCLTHDGPTQPTPEAVPTPSPEVPTLEPIPLPPDAPLPTPQASAACLQAIHKYVQEMPSGDGNSSRQGLLTSLRGLPELEATGISPDGTICAKFRNGAILFMLSESRAL